MAFYSIVPYTFFVILIITISEVGSANVPKTTTASIYQSGDKKGANVQYLDDLQLWSDFGMLKNKTEVTKPALICVNGVWLIYRYPNFNVYNPTYVHLLSGNDNCVQPGNAFLVNSMQPVSPYKFKSESITVFERKYFGAFALSYSPKGKKIEKFRRQWLPQLKSLITVGKSDFTLIDYSGKLVCVKPKLSLSNPICLAPDISAYGLPKDLQFVGVMKNCSADKSAYTMTLQLSNCFEFGSTKMEKIIDPSVVIQKDFSCPNAKKNKDEPPEDSNLVTKFAQLRFIHDFESPVQLLWPTREEDIWKTQILDTIFDIFMSICPQQIVPRDYLTVIREFTIYHLDEIWKTSGPANKTKNLYSEDMDNVADRMNECLGLLQESDQAFQDSILIPYNMISDPKTLDDQVYRMFEVNRKNDPVIEAAWLISNFAYGLCYHIHESRVDFWTDYASVLKNLYFGPLMDRWQNPKITPNTFRAIFGGYGMDDQFKRIGFCTSSMFDMTPNLMPLEKNFMNK